MKDPLRYYLAEGFMCLHHTLSEADIRFLWARMAGVNLVRVDNIDGSQSLLIDGVLYPLTLDFAITYSTPCESDAELDATVAAWRKDSLELLRTSRAEIYPALDEIP